MIELSKEITPHPVGVKHRKTFVDITGRKFGMLQVIEYVGTKGSQGHWFVRCDCGKEKFVGGYTLIKGETKSCGCNRNAAISIGHTIHGQSSNATRTREYRSWSHMKARCFCSTDHDFHHYGGRGITVCERWLDFRNFLEDMGPCPAKFTIERIDNDGNYDPSNCRWASRLDQGNNRRTNRNLTFNGESKSVSEWCRELGLNLSRIKSRLHLGWTTERALTKPARYMPPRYSWRTANKSLVQGTLL